MHLNLIPNKPYTFEELEEEYKRALEEAKDEAVGITDILQLDDYPDDQPLQIFHIKQMNESIIKKADHLVQRKVLGLFDYCSSTNFYVCTTPNYNYVCSYLGIKCETHSKEDFYYMWFNNLMEIFCDYGTAYKGMKSDRSERKYTIRLYRNVRYILAHLKDYMLFFLQSDVHWAEKLYNQVNKDIKEIKRFT